MSSVWINGRSGKMGREIEKAVLTESDLSFLGGSSQESSDEDFYGIKKAKLLLDFSNRDGNRRLLKQLKAIPEVKDLAIIIGTTGLNDEDALAWQELCRESEHKAILASNTSLGILLTARTAKNLAPILYSQGFDIEINETHHRHKIDSPSGTALFLAKTVAKACNIKVNINREGPRKAGEIGISSMRGGGVFGEHSIRFISEHEEISLNHRAFSRALFASGALFLGRWLLKNGKSGQMHSIEEVF